MASPSMITNQETPLPSMSFVFPPYGDVGPPLMVALILPGLTIGLPIWLFSSPMLETWFHFYASLKPKG